MFRRLALHPLAPTVVFVVLGLVWVLVSDRAVQLILSDGVSSSHMQSLKGSVFVLFSGMLMGSISLAQARKLHKMVEEQRHVLRRAVNAYGVLLSDFGRVERAAAEQRETVIGTALIGFVAELEPQASLIVWRWDGDERTSTYASRGSEPVAAGPVRQPFELPRGNVTAPETGVLLSQEEDAQALGLLGLSAPACVMLCPVVVAGRTLGLLELQVEEPHSDSLITARALQFAGDLTGLVWQNLDLLGVEEQARAAVTATEARYRSLYENSTDIIVLVTAAGDVIDAGSSYQRVLGRDPFEGSLALVERCHPHDQSIVARLLEDVQDRGSARATWRILDGSGRWRWMNNKAVNLLDDPSVGAIVLTGRDVTEAMTARIRLMDAHADIARLNEKLTRQLAHITALHAIDRAIIDGTPISEVFKIALNQARTLLGADAAAVLTHEPGTNRFGTVEAQGFLHASDTLLAAAAETHLAHLAMQGEERIVCPDPSRLRAEVEVAKLTELEGFAAFVAVGLRLRGELKGVLEVYFRQAQWNLDGAADQLARLGEQVTIALEGAAITEALKQSNRDLVTAYDTTIEGWAAALDLRDEETLGHSRRVTELSVTLARRLGMPESAVDQLRRGALLHDIGKMGIPDAILNKPGKLTPDEWEVMRQHPTLAYELLKGVPFLKEALDVSHYHHERWDGTGYPHGLAGTDIPLAARIFAVVDVFDALTNDRPYRAAWSRTEALEHIRAEAGRQFDTKVVEAFLAIQAGQ